MTTIWERLGQAATTAARPALSAQTIAAKAVVIADAEGLDAITMRRLATELGVAPMAAYRHLAGKDDVLELMVDLVYGEVELKEGAGWRETMRELATGIRAVVLRHPWLTRLSAPQAVYELTPNRLALEEQALVALGGLNLDADATMTVYRTVVAYVHGATRAEIGLQELLADRGWTTGAEARTGLFHQLNWLLETGRYPTFGRYVLEATRKDDLDWQFETGLGYVIDGIAARID